MSIAEDFHKAMLAYVLWRRVGCYVGGKVGLFGGYDGGTFIMHESSCELLVVALGCEIENTEIYITTFLSLCECLGKVQWEINDSDVF